MEIFTAAFAFFLVLLFVELYKWKAWVSIWVLSVFFVALAFLRLLDFFPFFPFL